MPAHDLRRPEDKKCGFIRSPSGSVVYTMCPDHPEHYLKGMEGVKIECAKKHFEAICKDMVLFDFVHDFKDLLNLVQVIDHWSKI